jgi:hypothetical protein
MKRTEEAEMRFLTEVADCRLVDKGSNKDIRGEVRIFCHITNVKEYRVNWLQHFRTEEGSTLVPHWDGEFQAVQTKDGRNNLT